MQIIDINLSMWISGICIITNRIIILRGKTHKKSFFKRAWLEQLVETEIEDAKIINLLLLYNIIHLYIFLNTINV